MKPPGYRQLLANSICRPWHPPLFGGPAPRHTARSLRLLVWTDDEYEQGAALGFDIFPGDGSTLELLARVAWVAPQPADAPARFRLGLTVYAQTDRELDQVERLLADE